MKTHLYSLTRSKANCAINKVYFRVCNIDILTRASNTTPTKNSIIRITIGRNTYGQINRLVTLVCKPGIVFGETTHNAQRVIVVEIECDNLVLSNNLTKVRNLHLCRKLNGKASQESEKSKNLLHKCIVFLFY